MSLEGPNSAPRVNPLVRWFVVGLPLGLLIMGALSFVIYFQKRHAKEIAATAPSRYAAMLRKELNLDDYRRYIRIFEQEIGPSTPDKAANIEAAQSFIESTLGFGNMGYQAVRREFDTKGKPGVDFEVELTGRNPSGGVHLVTARYDGVKSKDIAALLCLANALTGTTHRDTVRFVAWFGGGDTDAVFHLDRYRQWLPEAAAPRVTTLEISGPDPEDQGALGRLKMLEDEIRTLGGDPARK